MPDPTTETSTAPGSDYLREQAFCDRLGKSKAWARLRRSLYRKAAKAGHPEKAAKLSPKWIVLGNTIYYRVRDVNSWIEAHAVECGTVAGGK